MLQLQDKSLVPDGSAAIEDPAKRARMRLAREGIAGGAAAEWWVAEIGISEAQAQRVAITTRVVVDRSVGIVVCFGPNAVSDTMTPIGQKRTFERIELQDQTFIDANGKRVDRFEAVVRLICGSFLGLVLSICIAISFAPLSTILTASIFIITTLLIALVALRYGDDFWRNAIASLRGIV